METATAYNAADLTAARWLDRADAARRANEWCPAAPTLAWTWRKWSELSAVERAAFDDALDFAAAVRALLARRAADRQASAA